MLTWHGADVAWFESRQFESRQRRVQVDGRVGCKANRVGARGHRIVEFVRVEHLPNSDRRVSSRRRPAIGSDAL